MNECREILNILNVAAGLSGIVLVFRAVILGKVKHKDIWPELHDPEAKSLSGFRALFQIFIAFWRELVLGLAYLRVSVQRFAHLRNTFKRFSVGL